MIRTVISTAIILLFGTMIYGQKANKPSKEETAIKEVIENESKHFWARDINKWKDTYIHAPYVERTVATRDGVSRIKGWKVWYSEVLDLFSESPEPVPYDGIVKKYDYSFRIYGDGAWVSFTQDNGGTKTLETRIMEKDKDQWKIAMVHVVFDADQSEQADSSDSGK